MKKILIICLLLGSLAACSEKDKSTPKADAKRWVALARGTVDVSGGLVQVAAPRDGLVQSVAVKEGQAVVKGDILAVQDGEPSRLASAAAASELTEAEAAVPVGQIHLDAATRELHRLVTLNASHLATAQELEQARDTLSEVRAQLAQSQARVETAKVKLATADYEGTLRTIRSPLDGVIVHQKISPGETINNVNFTPLFDLAPAGQRIVRAEVEEESLPAIKIGQKAEIVGEQRDEKPIKARVERIGLVFGSQKTAVDEPSQRQDRHVVECILALENDSHLLLGQRVLVRFLPDRKP